jgi:hypothetical protein
LEPADGGESIPSLVTQILFFFVVALPFLWMGASGTGAKNIIVVQAPIASIGLKKSHETEREIGIRQNCLERAVGWSFGFGSTNFERKIKDS